MSNAQYPKILEDFFVRIHFIYDLAVRWAFTTSELLVYGQKLILSLTHQP